MINEAEKVDKKKKFPRFKRNLLISFLIGFGILFLWAMFLLHRNGWTIPHIATFLSDMFALAGACYIFVFVLCLLSRTTMFTRFGYLSQKAQAKRKKEKPQYRTMQDYLAARPEPSFDERLLWIPGTVYFALAFFFLYFTF